MCVCVCLAANYMFVFQANKITEKRKLILGIGVSFVDSGFYMNSWNRWEFIVYCGVILRLDYRSPTASFIIKSTILVLSLYFFFVVWFGLVWLVCCFCSFSVWFGSYFLRNPQFHMYIHFCRITAVAVYVRCSRMRCIMWVWHAIWFGFRLSTPPFAGWFGVLFFHFQSVPHTHILEHTTYHVCG